MRSSTTFLHGIADYGMSVVLLVAPWLFGFSFSSVATRCTMAFGVAMIVYSLFTDYELSINRLIPMSGHLVMDAIMGALLIAAPFIMGYASLVWVPHLVLGIVELGLAAATAAALGLPAMTGRRRGGKGMAG